MSKSAAKYIRANVSGRIADLCLDTLYSPDVRKNWRNADVLARFLIDTVANAYQCENSTTFADNGHADMEDAISSYIEANLCDWDQEKFLASSFGKQTAEEITARLGEWAFKNAAFEAKQKAAGIDQDAAHAEALEMARAIDTNFRFPAVDEATRVWCEEVRARWLVRRKVVRDAACGYNNAFLAFFHATDYDTFTHACIAWLHLMDEAIAYDQEHNAMREIKEVFDAQQPCSEAEHNAHYYQLLLAKRWKEQRVIMTTKNGAFNYILNDAIAGDMVKSVSLFTYTIDFRDGSVFDLRDGDWMPHGFYASVQAKRC